MKLAALRPIALGLCTMTALSSGCSDKNRAEEGELAAAASTQPATVSVPVIPDTLDEALQSEYRQASNKERDQFRHPKETLEFFGLQPTMRLVEISPGGGWYTEILAPYLTKKGTYIAALPASGDSEYMRKNEAKFREWFVSKPELKSTIIEFSADKPLAVGESVDMIVTFRNVHNWMNAGKGPASFKTFFQALKPGGVLGVVEHREDEKKKQDPKGKSGYVKESEVIKWAQQAGFKLDKKSEINANPKDTKDYAKGVWSLPPSYAEGEESKPKFSAIGESDRMTLRFIKPESPKAKGRKK